MKKIAITLLLLLLMSSCQLTPPGGVLTYEDTTDALDLKKLAGFNKDNYKWLGNHVLSKDTIISRYRIENKYSLIVIKLNNVPSDLDVKINPTETTTNGIYAVVGEDLYDLCYSTLINKQIQINSIDFFADNLTKGKINNDTIKSYSFSLDKFIFKVNDSYDKIFYGEINSLINFKKPSANILFYKLDGKMLIFILTPQNKDINIEDDFLYDYLFVDNDNTPQ